MCGCWSLRGRPDLGEKPLAAERRAEVGVEHFDGDVAVVLQVVGEVDGRHAAGAELALDAIAAGERGGKLCGAHRAENEPFTGMTSSCMRAVGARCVRGRREGLSGANLAIRTTCAPEADTADSPTARHRSCPRRPRCGVDRFEQIDHPSTPRLSCNRPSSASSS